MGRMVTPEEAPMPVGRQPKEIPGRLVQLLEEVYRRGMHYEEQLDDGDDVDELVKLCQLHARRRGLSFRYRLYDDDDGRLRICFTMCRKRVYTPTHTSREATP